MAGPFSDKSGGAYILKVNSLDEAIKVANEDPLFKSGSSKVQVWEWNAS